MKYGRLLICVETSNGNKFSLVRGLESLASPHGTPIFNELECPLLMLTHTVFTAKSSAISNAISVVHECDDSCEFVMKQRPRTIEREQLCLSSQLEYEHNYIDNYMYYLNVYCMHS